MPSTVMLLLMFVACVMKYVPKNWFGILGARFRHVLGRFLVFFLSVCA